MTDTDPRSADDDLELVVGVSARISRISTIVLSTLDAPLTFRQYRTLSRVLDGRDRLQQLARLANLSMPTVSETVDGLVRRGLMRTTRSATDGRAIVLHVTDEGAEAARAGGLALMEFVGSLVADLAPEDREHLRRTLGHVFDAATDYFAERLGRP